MVDHGLPLATGLVPFSPPKYICMLGVGSLAARYPSLGGSRLVCAHEVPIGPIRASHLWSKCSVCFVVYVLVFRRGTPCRIVDLEESASDSSVLYSCCA